MMLSLHEQLKEGAMLLRDSPLLTPRR